MAEKACHVVACATQIGLIPVLALMKQFFATSAACFVALLLFALIAIGALVVVDDLSDSSSDVKKPRSRTISPTGFNFIEHEQVAGTDTFTVRGVVQNSSKVTWSYPSIKIRVISNGSVLNICEGMLFGEVRPASTRAFLIECKDTQSPATAQPYKYEIYVEDAMQEG